ncbi:hypothetical protein C8Q70DRAFT_738920 [Cubamyces menziesii]|nr:hypothetical protein C8Q70DRAFT_738920 [Cubamyces menziesii]
MFPRHSSLLKICPTCLIPLRPFAICSIGPILCCCCPSSRACLVPRHYFVPLLFCGPPTHDACGGPPHDFRYPLPHGVWPWSSIYPHTPPPSSAPSQCGCTLHVLRYFSYRCAMHRYTGYPYLCARRPRMSENILFKT